MSNYYKPNNSRPVNNTERVTPAKPIPQPSNKAKGLANILGVNEPNVPSLNDVVFPLDKTPIENWVSYNQKVYGNSVEPLTASEKRVGEAVESKSVEPKAVKYKPKKDQWKYESWGDQQIATAEKQDKPKKKSPRMSATRSWNIIKQSLNKDELAEWYASHPEDKPALYKPYKPDPIIAAMYDLKFPGEEL
tara:strand:- start:58 stop:630 length:573 start_codon:yes stop_codon:yes gene_type:complete